MQFGPAVWLLVGRLAVERVCVCACVSMQGRIKGFVGRRHFSLLSPFLRLETCYWNYSVLSIIRAKEKGSDARII
jgi:hypothetical protein